MSCTACEANSADTTSSGLDLDLKIDSISISTRTFVVLNPAPPVPLHAFFDHLTPPPPWKIFNIHAVGTGRAAQYPPRQVVLFVVWSFRF